ncbi:hypothetical protein PIB30_070968 [Stylosanthes scabra]|uniref:Uncharacterized protein n=1 Tax=Stylosanthes scabra TaxID=79078 RepID=A0ABU6YMM9_9FABA|nr:hypothetical protein [Stylosanthes scabra]
MADEKHFGLSERMVGEVPTEGNLTLKSQPTHTHSLRLTVPTTVFPSAPPPSRIRDVHYSLPKFTSSLFCSRVPVFFKDPRFVVFSPQASTLLRARPIAASCSLSRRLVLDSSLPCRSSRLGFQLVVLLEALLAVLLIIAPAYNHRVPPHRRLPVPISLCY